MPQPSTEHAPIMRQLADEMRQAFPTASVFAWAVIDDRPVDGRALHSYISMLLTKTGDRLEGGMLNSPENIILRKYDQALGWDVRDEPGIGYVFSVTEAREVTDIEGTGTLDADYVEHPGLEYLS